MYSHSRCCRASRIDTARSAIQYRDRANKTQSEIFEGQGARFLIFRLSEVSRTPLTSPRLPQVRSQFQNAGRWTTRAYAVSVRACRAGRGLSHARTALREKTLAEGLVEGVIAVILSRWSRRSDLIRPMCSHSPCCRASRIDTARSAIQYRDSENKTQSEIFEGQGARLLISRLSEVSRTPLTSPRLPQVRSQFQNAGRWTTRAYT